MSDEPYSNCRAVNRAIGYLAIFRYTILAWSYFCFFVAGMNADSPRWIAFLLLGLASIALANAFRGMIRMIEYKHMEYPHAQQQRRSVRQSDEGGAMIWAVFLVVWVVLCLLIVMFVRGGTRKPSPKPPTKLQAVPPLPLGAWVEDRDE